MPKRRIFLEKKK